MKVAKKYFSQKRDSATCYGERDFWKFWMRWCDKLDYALETNRETALRGAIGEWKTNYPFFHHVEKKAWSYVTRHFAFVYGQWLRRGNIKVELPPQLLYDIASLCIVLVDGEDYSDRDIDKAQGFKIALRVMEDDNMEFPKQAKGNAIFNTAYILREHRNDLGEIWRPLTCIIDWIIISEKDNDALKDGAAKAAVVLHYNDDLGVGWFRSIIKEAETNTECVYFALLFDLWNALTK